MSKLDSRGGYASLEVVMVIKRNGHVERWWWCHQQQQHPACQQLPIVIRDLLLSMSSISFSSGKVLDWPVSVSLPRLALVTRCDAQSLCAEKTFSLFFVFALAAFRFSQHTE